MADTPRLNRIFRFEELTPFVGRLSASRLKVLIKQGKFPRAIKITEGGRAVGWIEADLIAWQNARIAERNSTAA